MKDRLRAAAHALRNFFRGFLGTAPIKPASHDHGDESSTRPFCC